MVAEKIYCPCGTVVRTAWFKTMEDLHKDRDERLKKPVELCNDCYEPRYSNRGKELPRN